MHSIDWPRIGMIAGIAYLAAHALTGRQSVPVVLELTERERVLTHELAALKSEQRRLADEVARLDDDHLDRDYLEERARILIAAAHPEEILIPAPQP
jgi:cell division protein FtsB